jgi:hypothetical protein
VSFHRLGFSTDRLAASSHDLRRTRLAAQATVASPRTANPLPLSPVPHSDNVSIANSRGLETLTQLAEQTGAAPTTNPSSTPRSRSGAWTA